MTDQIENAALTWRDGDTPIATAFDDPYFSLHDGLGETRHVFIGGNDLPARFAPDFHIAELGFGTGLNLLATWQAWIEAGHTSPLNYTSFEAFPMEIPHMRRALNHWPELSPLAEQMLVQLEKGFQINTPTLRATIIIGDARQTLPRWDGLADAWYLDGFSPAKNPELWDADLLCALGQHTAPHGTFATYSAAGYVRQRLTDAGFNVTRIAGFGRKRHMAVGKRT
ncbi:FAD-dependent oxidoreductase [Amylibacter marinus]|uniref:FAD-dependent oxidoreductase n=1 Tax=Amylibacter marinus TaxID=1475483 RepID=A0ABQ5VWB6_9RHOB|nr:tRNA (5-methylaminomethyl-2-thiouridine)(34)-methyltransferase MnmD [Amylibacter marinus]GLQ35731.1 FAD-dependent oxidoreductase [Amylibacter marinus]